MRLIADENFPRDSVLRLRQAGHDVLWAGESCPAASDEDILALARREDRVAVTFDRDFGELVFRRRLPVPPGVVYLRFVPASPTHAADVLAEVVARIEVKGRFTVVRLDDIRQRPLPSHPR